MSLFDEVHAAWADPDTFTVTVSGEGVADVPTDERNLALRAARLLADSYGEGQPLGVALAIHKSIPVAGGLAGGSSNGAAALLACADLWAMDVSLDQMLSSSRAAPVAWPRQVAMYLARELTDQTLPAIGRAFGGRNHTTVMHACRRTAERMATDRDAYDAVRRLTEDLGGGR